MPQIQRIRDQPRRRAIRHAQRTAEFGGGEIPDGWGALPTQPDWVFGAGQSALHNTLTWVKVCPMSRDQQPAGLGCDQDVFIGLRSGEGFCRIQLHQLIFEHPFNIRWTAYTPRLIRRVAANGQHPTDQDNTWGSSLKT